MYRRGFRGRSETEIASKKVREGTREKGKCMTMLESGEESGELHRDGGSGTKSLISPALSGFWRSSWSSSRVCIFF